MANEGVTPRSEDYARWYTDIVIKADLADYAPVRGCMIIKPYGYELWEAIKGGLDRRFKATGHKNAYFPLLIPMSFLQREAEHVEGFAPELAVVTHGGGKELEEPLVIRPTSETIIGEAFKQWIQSHRDLPLLINQWANVVRWEKRTRLFLRTTEFLWQEGHTAHATHEEALEETLRILDIYADFAINDAAIPVIKGRKSESERFKGALTSYTIEGMMGNKWALQAGTSHDLGQNFARVFDIKYLDENNELQICWTTSWGVSTRMVGGVIMVHGDDQGLRMPPKIAPIQVVIVPIYKNDEEKSAVMESVARVADSLLSAKIRTHVDDREGLRPGFKFNDWEMRGVPLRVEIGPRDVQNRRMVIVRRDLVGKEAKSTLLQEGIIGPVTMMLNTIQSSLLSQATEFRDANLHQVDSYDELKDVVENGWALAWHCDEIACEDKIQEETKSTARCFPVDQEPGDGKCVICGKKTTERAYFARAY